MKYVVSQNAKRSFEASNGGYIEPLLIEASTKKIRQYYSQTYDGKDFYSGKGGVEKIQKLDLALVWISNNNEINAPVIDLKTDNATDFFFADGRHTCVALEMKNYACIKVAVPKTKAALLSALLCY